MNRFSISLPGLDCDLYSFCVKKAVLEVVQKHVKKAVLEVVQKQ